MKSEAIVSEITYFSRPGPENTETAVREACRRARELGIDEMVVATQEGDTALRAAEVFPEGKITAVTYHSGASEPFDRPLSPSVRKELESRNVRVLTCSHALSGAERAIDKAGGWAPLNLVAETLRMFGQGAKVCVEITLMAADAGFLSGDNVIAVGGSGRGADTALVISPANQNRMFSLRIKEIICKPAGFNK